MRLALRQAASARERAVSLLQSGYANSSMRHLVRLARGVEAEVGKALAACSAEPEGLLPTADLHAFQTATDKIPHDVERTVKGPWEVVSFFFFSTSTEQRQPSAHATRNRPKLQQRGVCRTVQVTAR